MKITSVLAAAVFAASALSAPVASAQRGVGHVEPMPRVEPVPRIEPMPDYSPPQDTQISRDRDWDRPTIHAPPPEERRGANDYSGGPDDDGDGVSNAYDCNDRNASVYPGAPEVYNGRDDNCDGAAY